MDQGFPKKRARLPPITKEKRLSSRGISINELQAENNVSTPQISPNDRGKVVLVEQEFVQRSRATTLEGIPIMKGVDALLRHLPSLPY